MDALLQSLSQYCSQDVHRAEVSSADLTGQGSASEFTYMVFGRIWTEPLRSSLIILARSLSHFPCPVDLSSILACFTKARETEVERVCWQDESHSLLIPIIKVTPHHLCHSPLVISKTLDSAHFQGKRMTQRCKYQQWR